LAQKQIDLKTKKAVNIPFDEVMMNMSFIEMPDEDYVLALKPNATSVIKYFEQGGEPVINPGNKKPFYNFNGGMSVQILSREEYQSMLEATKRKLMR
jgi:hypothetical protein